MGAFKNWQGSQRLIHLLIIQLIVWFGWLSNIALALTPIDETVTGSLSLPGIGIACIGNLAVFVTSLLRGRLDLEMGARDVLATMRGRKLEDINNGFGLTTSKEYHKASVVMFSSHTPNLSIRHFVKYICNVYNVHSIIIQCFPEKCSASQAVNSSHTCKCVVFSTVEEVIILLAVQIPGTLKQLSDNLFLLPSQECLDKGCHGCNQGLRYAKDESGNNKLTEGETIMTERESIKRWAVVETLNHLFQKEEEKEHKCICIPLCPSGHDYWTKLLSRSFGVRDTTGAVENFSTPSLIVPRLAEVLVNLVLTGWFRVDGFSSSLVARRAIRDYVGDTYGSGFAAYAFLTKAESKVSSQDNTKYVCHVLTFRGTLGTFSFITCAVNLICAITWVVLIALNGSVGKWYDSYSIPLSKSRVVVMMAFIGIILAMDCLHLYLSPRSTWPWTVCICTKFLVLAVILLEIICLVASSVIMGTLGVEVFGKWLYSVVQVLVWVKWIVGSYLLGDYPPEYDFELHYGNGILVYSSIFLLNSVLAGVRGNWHYSLSLKD